MFKLAPTKPSSADPQKEPILVETTDASKIAEDESPSISPPDAAKVSPENSWFFIQFSFLPDYLTSLDAT